MMTPQLSPLLLSPPLTWWGAAGAAPLALHPSEPSTQASMVRLIPDRCLSQLHIWPWSSTFPFVWVEAGVCLEALHIDGLPGLFRGAQTPTH